MNWPLVCLLAYCLLHVTAAVSFKQITWYINKIAISNIPSFDSGINGDADNTYSDVYITLNDSESGVKYTSPVQLNSASFSYGGTRYYSSYTSTTPSGYMLFESGMHADTF